MKPIFDRPARPDYIPLFIIWYLFLVCAPLHMVFTSRSTVLCRCGMISTTRTAPQAVLYIGIRVRVLNVCFERRRIRGMVEVAGVSVVVSIYLRLLAGASCTALDTEHDIR